MLLLLAVPNLLCYIASAVGGEAVERITTPPVEFSVASVDQCGYTETRVQAERGGREGTGSNFCSGLTTEDVCATARSFVQEGEVNLFEPCSRWRVRLKSGWFCPVEQTQEQLQNAA